MTGAPSSTNPQARGGGAAGYQTPYETCCRLGPVMNRCVVAHANVAPAIVIR